MTKHSLPEFKSLLLRVVVALLVLIVGGTAGYAIVEKWEVFDAFYMVIITITTTGYGEVRPLSAPGRVLSIILMVAGIGTFFYGLNVIIPALVGRRMERWKRVLENIEDHYLLCGFGEMGQEIAGELSYRLEKSKVVVLDPDFEKVSLAREKGYLGVQGQPASEETLEEARVDHAKAIVATKEDSENAFSIMVAKDLNPNIYALAISQSETGAKNIRRAGADYVLSPYVDTAKKVSTLLYNPIAADFTELVSEIAEVGMLQKVSLREKSLSGQTLQELDLRAKTGALIILIERSGEIIRPTPKLSLQVEDNLYLLGNEEELKAASRILVGRQL